MKKLVIVLLLLALTLLINAAPVYAQPRLPAPDGFRLITDGVAWDSVADATGYLVRFRYDNQHSDVVLAASATQYIYDEQAGAGQLTFATVESGTKIRIQIRALADDTGANRDSRWREPLELRILVLEPGLHNLPWDLPPPRNFRLASGTTVAWDDMTEAIGFRLRWNGDNGERHAQSLDGDQTQFTLANLTAGVSYSVKVRALGDGVLFEDKGRWTKELTLSG